ncbi:dihydrolipoamide acetyltransferase family protein [Saccharomonospora halophila]|uniref:dihydrolipoamide acetyltransferase family protein n=1 Tax=Saccharomonospora halophila TaxID=129922 RepID=UPI0003661D78|nr:dihydrolipoamide acetyltransferase family protein [Saccharomonospora halophila]
MTQLRQFTLPDLGEGLVSGEVVGWRVRPGDTVTTNQPIAELETAKAVVELPCPFAGTVVELLVPEGATAEVGTPLFTVEVEDPGDAPPDSVPVLVGYGASPPTTKRRPRRRSARKAGPEDRVPVRGEREHTATAMARSAADIPQMSAWLQIDATGMLRALDELRDDTDFAGVPLSPLLPVAHALLRTIERYPWINASWDGANHEIVVKRYVNLGIAVSTEHGPAVPNVKDAHLRSLPELARAIPELVARARAHTTSPEDLAGGTVTLTNAGPRGVDAGTPILSPGESAALALGRIRKLPWVHRDELTLRPVTTLVLSCDHRIVDGELASSVLRDIGDRLEDPDQ